jgi:predicted ATPase/signal transduction histidine kinase/GAF domain-containing protein/ActR/RegA family two-component response regulator
MTECSEYVLETLREGAEFAHYRGRQPGSPISILVVALTAEQPSAQSLRRLEREYSLAAELDSAWASRPLTLARHDGRPMLVLEDPGGAPLDRILDRCQGQPMELNRFLRIAVGLTEVLGQVHRRGLIHKDIKPANVLVDVETGRAWLTGFGIASRLPRERQAPETPEIIAGTLAYMAPEQTGRMNRSIDSRSDLYALGVTFYEMLTGTLPFKAADPMGWVHSHIARQAHPPNERAKQIPEVLSSLVMKLLAKASEARYQTAAGLEADLRRCQTEWQEHCRIAAFPLGTRDLPDRLLIPERLYGREREVSILVAAYDRVVAHGATELVLVSGYSGIGKSSVVNELHKVLVPPRGLFASGKFDQYKRDIPYATLAQAFQNLIRPILGQSEAKLSRWQYSLQEALGANGALIVNLIPELELIIGKQPPVAELSPLETQKRFQMVFRRFVGVFARQEHPLALFLDDLQWLDAATLDLLEHLVTDPELRYLLLVGAYRDNEVRPFDPLMQTLDEIRRSARVSAVALAPLALHDVERLIADSLHCGREHAQPLSQLVQEKTAGNPFFVIQFISALAEEGLIEFDRGKEAWIWDLARIRAKGFTDNVVDLMVGKLRRLPNMTVDALKLLACLGSTAEIATLGMIGGEVESSVDSHMWEAARAGLVLRQDSSYAFLHDRVQEAAYSLISADQRGANHLRIGRCLAAAMSNESLTQHVFDVVNQFNHGVALISDPGEIELVADLNLRAGSKAKASTAYASACRYFAAGTALLGPSGWTTRYDLAFDLALGLADCTYLSSRFDEAEELAAELLHRAASIIDKAAAYRLRINLHVVKSEYRRAVDSALECLRLFGIDMSAHPSADEVRAEHQKIWRNLGDRQIESLIDLPRTSSPEVRAAMRVLTALTSPAFLTDRNLHHLHVCQMVNLSLTRGMTNASPHGYGWLGWILCYEFRRYDDGYRFGKLAVDLVEKRGFDIDPAKVQYAMGLIVSWKKPLAISIDFFRAAFRSGAETGDLIYATYAASEVIIRLILTGVVLDEVWRESEKFMDFAGKIGFRDATDMVVSQQRLVAAMRGRTAGVSTFSDAAFDERAFEAELTADRLPLMAAWYWILKIEARFLSGDHPLALEAIERAKQLLAATPGEIQLLDYHLYSALTLASLAATKQREQRSEWLAQIKEHREQILEWMQGVPETFASAAALVEAEIARIEDRDLDAMRLYERAIQQAREHGPIQNEGLANELAAQFYAARGFAKISHLYLRDARYCYLRWGAEGKVRQLEQLHPHLREKPTPASPTFGAPLEQLDVGTVVRASQAVSGEIVLGKLTETLMRIAVEHAGAERGLLVLARGNERRIEAEATIVSDGVAVRLLGTPLTPSELPYSILQYVARTQTRVILDDASAPTPFSADQYIRDRRARSVLCLPLVKQAKLIGLLYLENNLAPGIFTPQRIALLELLASQAAISLENAHLYSELTVENRIRRQAEEDLRRSEVYLAEAQRLSQTGSFGWTPSSGTIKWSDETFRIFEYDRAITPTVKLIDQRVHRNDVTGFRQVVERASHDGQDFDHEYRLQMPDGRVKHIHVVAHATRNATGDVDFVGAVMDVTLAKETEDRIRFAQAERERLEQRLRQAEKMEAVGRLAGGIAHDFNNVLAGVFAYGEMLYEETTENSPLKRYAKNVLTAASRGRALVEQILAYSRSQLGKHVPVDVTHVVAETLELLRGSLPPGIHLESSAPELPLIVIGDATQLHQVVMNLCSNAVQAMSEPGTLRVALEAADLVAERALSHGSLEPGRYVRLAVEDSGSGMDDATLARIFEPFFTTKEVGRGTGLGLSLVYAIVTDVGGAIDVQSALERGSTFAIYLARTEAALVAAGEAAMPLPRGNGERVLLVEDEASLLALAAEVLARLGYEPVSFSDSYAALAAFNAEPGSFDVVITDDVMPGLTGTALAKRLRRQRPDLPIVLVSGYSDPNLTEQTLAAGITALLAKPVQSRQIATTLARVLAPQRRAFRSDLASR